MTGNYVSIDVGTLRFNYLGIFVTIIDWLSILKKHWSLIIDIKIAHSQQRFKEYMCSKPIRQSPQGGILQKLS